MFSRALIGLVSAFLLTNAPGQAVLNKAIHHAVYDQGLFRPLGELSAVSNSSFTTLRHPEHPQHAVRIQKSTFCDGTVPAYTGYIDVQARHLFFYFFESRSDPDRDDVIMWINGGPGASSALGLFMELGPCRIEDSDGPKFFNESWNSNANIFFIDQPVGVGFSYADFGEYVSTSEEGGIDIAAFVSIFFEHFTKFKGRPFHMIGESYAGRYLPVFASVVYDTNPHLVQSGLTPINLTSVVIGNGITDYKTMYSGYYEFACTSISQAPVIDISTCVQMKLALPRCNKWVQESCIDVFDKIACLAANDFCNRELLSPYMATGRNPYDVAGECDPSAGELCYGAALHVEKYLSDPQVQADLGVDNPGRQNFTIISEPVSKAFTVAMDWYSPTTTTHVAALLERGVKVLIYAGENDFVCNWLGIEKWVDELEWTGHDDFVKNRGGERHWYVAESDGRNTQAGRTRKSGGLTFATIEGAGHMAPYNKPKESLEMVKRWIKGHDL